MNCPNCNAPVQASDEKFLVCSFCGTRFTNPDAARPQPIGDVDGVMSQVFADKDGDGVPDIFQKMGGDPACSTQTVVQTRVTVNGKTYDNMDDVPPEIRKMLDGLNAGMLGGAETVRTVRTAKTTRTVDLEDGGTVDPSAFVARPVDFPLPSESPSRRGSKLPAIVFFLLGLAAAGTIAYLVR